MWPIRTLAISRNSGGSKDSWRETWKYATRWRGFELEIWIETDSWDVLGKVPTQPLAQQLSIKYNRFHQKYQCKIYGLSHVSSGASGQIPWKSPPYRGLLKLGYWIFLWILIIHELEPPEKSTSMKWNDIFIMWLVVEPYPSEKYESQLRLLFPTYGTIKHVPNHQPD